ncbi:hypothetical protein ACWEKT_20635 [Nocardia takedensis]
MTARLNAPTESDSAAAVLDTDTVSSFLGEVGGRWASYPTAEERHGDLVGAVAGSGDPWAVDGPGDFSGSGSYGGYGVEPPF